jgi:hypothetical protein
MQLMVSGHKDAQKAQEKRDFLEQRGFTVQVFGPATALTIETTELDDGCIASGDGWVVVGRKA